MITFVTILYYYLTTKDYPGLTLIIKWAIFCIVITAIISIIASFINPLYARLFTSSPFEYMNTSEGSILFRMGVGTYSFGQGLICLLPCLIYYYKQEKKPLFTKWMLILYITFMYIALLRMQFFANILLATVVMIISMLGSKYIKLSISIVFTVISIALFIPKDFFSDVLNATSNTFDVGSENYKKMTDMAEFINTEDLESSGTGKRLSRYPVLFETFSKNPIFGNASSKNPDNIKGGYHLHWMGKLSATGILGLLLFFYPHYFLIKSWFKHFKKQHAYFLGISILSFLALGFMKTIAGRDIWGTYLFIIPGMYYLSIINKDTYRKNTRVRKRFLNKSNLLN
jgi:hypothetical protein